MQRLHCSISLFFSTTLSLGLFVDPDWGLSGSPASLLGSGFVIGLEVEDGFSLSLSEESEPGVSLG